MYFINLEKYTNIPVDILDILLNKKRVNEKKELLSKYGDELYSFVLFELALIEVKKETAKEIFEKTKRKKHILEKKLNSTIDFRVALLDFLIKNKKKYIKNPIIIEKALFLNLEKFSLVDELTGLRNFRYYNIRIKEEINLAKRNTMALSIVIFDLDNFKKLNDTYGHSKGNKILKSVANIIRESIRKSDIAIRFGGDEFLIILPNTNKDGAFKIGNKIRRRVKKELYEYKITISGGVATYPVDTLENNFNLFEIADKSLYYSKFQGRDKITSFLLERRKENRIYIINNENIKIIFDNPNILNNKEVKLLNISKNGMSLKSDIPIKSNLLLKGKILKQDLFFEFEGTVLWIQKEMEKLYTIGIKFTHFTVDELNADEIAG